MSYWLKAPRAQAQNHSPLTQAFPLQEKWSWRVEAGLQVRYGCVRALTPMLRPPKLLRGWSLPPLASVSPRLLGGKQCLLGDHRSCWYSHGSFSTQNPYALRGPDPFVHPSLALQDTSLLTTHYTSAPLCQVYWAPSVGQASLPLRGHVAISGDRSGCHNKGCSWHLVGRGPLCTQDGPAQRMVRSAVAQLSPCAGYICHPISEGK